MILLAVTKKIALATTYCIRASTYVMSEYQLFLLFYNYQNNFWMDGTECSYVEV